MCNFTITNNHERFIALSPAMSHRQYMRHLFLAYKNNERHSLFIFTYMHARVMSKVTKNSFKTYCAWFRYSMAETFNLVHLKNMFKWMHNFQLLYFLDLFVSLPENIALSRMAGFANGSLDNSMASEFRIDQNHLSLSSWSVGQTWHKL